MDRPSVSLELRSWRLVNDYTLGSRPIPPRSSQSISKESWEALVATFPRSS
jgi:hypothetical protein